MVLALLVALGGWLAWTVPIGATGTYYDVGVARSLGEIYSLQYRTTEGPVADFDRAMGRYVNRGAGLMSFGPLVTLDPGRYALTFDIALLQLDPDEPYLTVDIYRTDSTGATHRLRDPYVIDAREFVANPRVEFTTPGGIRHEFAVFVSSAASKLAIRKIEIAALETRYGSYLGAAALAGAFTLALYAGFVRIGSRRWRSEFLLGKERPVLLFFLLFGAYALLVLQPYLDIKSPSLTGDAPNYLVLADYIRAEKTLDLPSIEAVYDEDRYIGLTGTRIYDPERHVHQVGERVFPHHQYGYAVLLALLLGLVRSAETAMLFSAFAVALGVVFVYKALLLKLDRQTAFVLALVTGASPPVLFFALSVFTETIAFAVVAFAIYALVLAPGPVRACLAAVLLGVLLFLKAKYAFFGVPLLLGYALLGPDKRSVVAVWAIYVVAAALFGWHTYAFTGSVAPFSWYADVGSHTGPVSDRLAIGAERFVSYLIDQRYGMFLVAPFTLLLIPGMAKVARAGLRDKRVLVLVGVAMAYLGLYAISGSWGGNGPALRPHIAIWPILCYLLFALVVELKNRSHALLIALSGLFAAIMLLTHTYVIGYGENYSKFYEAVAPFEVKLHEALPNFSRANPRVAPQIAVEEVPSTWQSGR